MFAKRISQFLKSNLFLLLLILISTFISYKNYVPGTFLTGWDTLHPEFNLKMYWGRIIDGVWQEHQGLGAVGSQAHASEIPRIAIMSVLSLFLKLNQLRYAYAFLMLIIGPVGVYLLIRRFLSGEAGPSQNIEKSKFSLEFGAFSGGLLYLLNLGTLQHFYVPLEMFLTHYGFLGFVFLFATKYFDSGKRKDLFWFSIFTLLIAPQAHTSTLFFAYFLIFLVFLFVLTLTYLIKKISKPRTVVSRGLLLTLFTLTINSFWLLPNIYFVINHGEEIKLSKIHHLFSTEAFLANQRFGNLESVAILRNFLFKWGEHVGNAQFGELLQEWDAHLHSFMVANVGYMFFIFIAIGLTIAVVSRQKYGFAMASVFFTAMFFLFNLNPPLGFLFDFLQKNIPLFQEAFRFPFTKFSIAQMLSYSVFFGYFFYYVLEVISNIPVKVFKKILTAIIVLFIPLTLYVFMFPAFKGYLISPSMKVSIPQRYFDLFSYLNKQEKFGRVANLPIHSFWGWVYYNWDPKTELGYQGAGFLWFGIKQPLMDREFDRWNLLNEGYYMEMSEAVYSKNPAGLKSVLEKYKIRWILVDESIIAPGADEKELFFPEINKLLLEVPEIMLSKDFGYGLKLYEYAPSKNYSLVEEVDNYYKSGDVLFKEYNDPMYENFGNYINYGEKTFPYVGITNYDETIKPGYIESDDNFVRLVDRSQGGQNYIISKKTPIPFDVYVGFSGKDVVVTMKSKIGNQTLEKVLNPSESADPYIIKVGKDLFQFSKDENNTEPSYVGETLVDYTSGNEVILYKNDTELPLESYLGLVLESCGETPANSSYSLNRQGSEYAITAKRTRACITTPLGSSVENRSFSDGDILYVSYEGEGHLPEKDVCVFNTQRGLCENNLLPNKINYVELKEPVSSYILRFFSDARDSVLPKISTYKNVKVGLLKKVASDVILGGQADASTTSFSGDLIFKKNQLLSNNVLSLFSNPRPCDGEKDGANYSIESTDDSLIYSSKNQRTVCDTFSFPTISHSTGLVLEVVSKNINGSPLRLCLTNESSKRCDLYVELPQNKEKAKNFYLVPPTEEGFGYTVNISNLVFGDETSTNELFYLGLTPVPYNLIRSVRLQTNELPDTADKKLLVYNQAFEKGWVAFCGLTPCNYEHVLVNNWANGWVLPKDVDTHGFRVVFLPQTLEYFGFLLSIGTFIVLFIQSRKTK